MSWSIDPGAAGFADPGGGSDGITLLKTRTNNAGGTLGGISNGEDLFFRVAVSRPNIGYQI